MQESISNAGINFHFFKVKLVNLSSDTDFSTLVFFSKSINLRLSSHIFWSKASYAILKGLESHKNHPHGALTP